ncbi:WD repeat-containing protein 54-like [Orbicella faveolata]|uniref:WD repeat-containing protein 54-like n=1 Tax=Orbicella faveolata TaxID=48498 RepID=UPI0009E32B1F|nr:WD repeat-containing protein 54-like [Orbicella faveolata]
MFVKGTSVGLKASASSLCNNLTVLSSKEKQSVTYGVVHKAFVCITNVTKGAIVNQRQVSCKGEGAHSSSAVLQAKWCELPERTVLVITSVKGAQMFETDGSLMIFWQALGESKEGVYSHFARGITAVGDKYICVGTSEGGIMVFDIPPRGTAVKLQETLNSHKVAICELEAQGGRMLSSDEEGNITLWQSGGHFTEVIKIDGKGFPCSSLCFYKDLIIGGFATGHIRVFSASSGAMCIEACAHARWISAMDICLEAGLLISASEDSFVRVWKLSVNEHPMMEMVFQQAITDAQLCGARFVDLSGNSFGVTAYDLGEIMIFSKQQQDP